MPEVGSEQRIAAGTGTQHDVDGQIALLEGLFEQGVEIQIGGLPLAEQLHAAQGHHHIVGVEVRPAAAHGGDDAPPVRVAPVQGRLYQLRVPHRPGHALGIGTGCRPGHMDTGNLGRALAVLYQHIGQIPEYGGQGGGQRLERFLVGRGHAGCAVGKAIQRVVRGGVAVHGHAVEGQLHGVAQHFLPDGGFHLRVTQHDGQHGRHVGADHASALGHAHKLHHTAGKGDFAVRNLVESIRGHDRPGKILRGRLAEVGGEGGGGLLPKIHLELRADNARGRGQDIRRLKAEGASHQLLGRAAVSHTFITGAGVGLAGIDHDGTSGGTLGEHGLGDENGCRRKTVLRKRPCGDGGDIADEKGKIRAAFLTESGTRGGETKAFGSGGHVAILTNR